MKTRLIASADPERLETWERSSAGLCRDCHAPCCTLPEEVRIDDLIR
ncbi:MAG TPA: Fe-S-oxidoreductase, partial [Pseudomonas sp.]|nr:Fe-S-oxidoreductase [Pseudomonas sp.]